MRRPPMTRPLVMVLAALTLLAGCTEPPAPEAPVAALPSGPNSGTYVGNRYMGSSATSNDIPRYEAPAPGCNGAPCPATRP